MLRVYRPIPAAQLKLLIFDLDGTLIDSRRDLSESVNATLSHFQLARQPESQIASYIGDGAALLIERALSAAGSPQHTQSLAAPALAWFLDYYRDHKLDHTRLYPGVLDALHTLQQGLGVPMAVLTNKPVVPSQQICDALGLAPFFFAIYGGNSFPTKKPAPHGIQHLMTQAGATPAQTLMVGDSHVDIETARSVGAFSLACRFGLSPHSLAPLESAQLLDAAVDHASQWPQALGLPSPIPVATTAGAIYGL